MSQHLYTSISVFRYWHRVDELTEQKVRSERGIVIRTLRITL